MLFDKILFRFFLVWYAVGFVLVGFNLLPPWLEWANVVFLILAGTLGAIYFIRTYETIAAIIGVIFIFSLSMFIEYLGATYNFLFGSYDYTASFGMKILNVPITIGFAWLMVIATTDAIVHKIFPYAHRLIHTTLCAVGAVTIDLVIDPVAYKVKEYWIWDGTSLYYDIPYQNFFGWFLLAWVIHIVLSFLLTRRKDAPLIWNTRMIAMFFLIIIMFAFICLINKLYLALLVTLLPFFLFMLGLIGRFQHDFSSEKSSIS